MLKGMLITFKHLFRSPFTVQYPEEVRPIPHRARTNLVWFEERCTGCSTCAQSCPDGCILVATSPRPDGSLNVDRYEIDFRLCMYCGLCTEACPYHAIQPGGTYEDSVYVFDHMYKNKDALRALAAEYLRENDFTYPHGLRAPEDIVKKIMSGEYAERSPVAKREPVRWPVAAGSKD
jgi:NADH-quinone oxidoreductase subunit I